MRKHQVCVVRTWTWVGVALLLSGKTVSAQPIAVPTGDVDLTVLVSSFPTLGNVRLVKWRTGAPNQTPQPAADISLAYLSSTGTITFPSRSGVGDNSANDQGTLWTDNALEVDFQKGNQLNQAILIYTDNTVFNNDLLGLQDFKGGLIGGAGCRPIDVCWGFRGSVLTLLWKAVTLSDLTQVSDASAQNPIPATSLLYMPTEITDRAQPNCPAEGPYPASTRPSPYEYGFCDYSTHFFMDKNNSDPNNLFYDQYPVGSIKRQNAFRYASLVGPFGINTLEPGVGVGGTTSPLYAVLGINLRPAQPTTYATTIYVNLLQI